MAAIFDSATLALSDPASGAISWSADTIKALVVSPSYVFSRAHTKVSDITNELAGTGYARKTLAGKTQTLDTVNHRTVFSSDALTYTSINAGTMAAVVLFKDTGTGDANCPLIAFCDFSNIITSGATVGIAPPSGGWLNLSGV